MVRAARRAALNQLDSLNNFYDVQRNTLGFHGEEIAITSSIHKAKGPAEHSQKKFILVESMSLRRIRIKYFKPHSSSIHHNAFPPKNAAISAMPKLHAQAKAVAHRSIVTVVYKPS